MRFCVFICLCALIALPLLGLMPPFPLQVFLLLLCLATFFMALSAALTSKPLRAVCIAIGIVFTPLVVAEAFFYQMDTDESGRQVQRGGIFTQGLARPDAQLGYAPVPSAKVPSRAVRNGEELYHVTYTLNDKGWRVTPDAPEANTAIVFFGCSYTFGEGLQDEETLAWKLGKILGPRYQVYNFGFSGYGPHHMQAIIERGLPELDKYKHIQAFHIAIRGHQRRVAGISPWDRHGPRYMLKDGKAVRHGTFADNPPFVWEGAWGAWLERSFTFVHFKQQLSEQLVPLNTLEARLNLTRAIIATSAETMRAQWPQSSFTVLAWPPESVELLQGLASGVPVLDVQQWLPNYAELRGKYIISHDRHPNALANALVAEKLAALVREASNTP